MKHALTPDEKRAIIDRYTRGQSIGFIAYAVSRDRRGVVRTLREAGVKIRKSGRQASSNWGYTGFGREP